MSDPNFPPPAEPTPPAPAAPFTPPTPPAEMFPPSGAPSLYTPPPVEVKNNLATVALVCGIAAAVCMIFNWVPVTVLSYIACGAPIFGLAALITGIMALKTAKKNNGIGRGFALTGLILGSVILGLFVLIFAVGFLLGFAQAMGG